MTPERPNLPGIGRDDVAVATAGRGRWQPGRGISLESHQAAQIEALTALLDVCLDHLMIHDETCRLLDDVPAALRTIGVRP